MVKFVKILLSICVFACGLNPDVFLLTELDNLIYVNAQETETSTYAKALFGCNLYKTQEMSSRLEDVYFQVPETYFVLVLDTVNDNCLKVQYDRYIGYVDSSTVIIATFIPIVKTLDNITFDIKPTSGTQIWQSPTTKSNICTTLSAGTKNIKYVGFAYGSVPTSGESNIWYYVYYTPDENSTNVFEGYIYSENAMNLSEIVANTETNPEVISNENELDNKTIYITSTIKTIIIAIVTIPIILFFAIILYKLVQKIKKNTICDKNKKLFLTKDSFENNQNNNLVMDKYKDMKLVKNKHVDFMDFNDDELL